MRYYSFEEEPDCIFSVRDLRAAVRLPYAVTTFQEEPDPLHPQPRTVHEVRSRLGPLKREGRVTYVGRN